MHGTLLGTTKVLIYLWFSLTNSTEPYFVGNQLKEILKRMSNRKTPHCVDRLPRDLEVKYNSFKATEYQIFFLYYDTPCLFEILCQIYLSHFTYFSESEVITVVDLEKAECLCDKFYEQFAEFYGIENCGLNIHNTGIHVADFVRSWGSVSEWSNFGYEDENGHLIKGVAGIGNVTLELFSMKLVHSACCKVFPKI